MQLGPGRYYIDVTSGKTAKQFIRTEWSIGRALLGGAVAEGAQGCGRAQEQRALRSQTQRQVAARARRPRPGSKRRGGSTGSSTDPDRCGRQIMSKSFDVSGERYLDLEKEATAALSRE
jgi:hypothetical protein